MPLDPGWKNTVDTGVSDKRWDEYDPLIQREVAEYNRRFTGTPGFAILDWKIFKAMVWTEGGGPSKHAWKTRPIQIGNPGDKGLTTLRRGLEGADLIMSDTLKEEIKGNINKPELNIRAGIAYALTRLSKAETRSVDDPKDSAVREYTVVSGDSLDRIAHKVGSTLSSMQKLNPTAGMLHPGQKVKYRKASLQHLITGWWPVTTSNLALRYNVGDPTYKEKLDYVLSLFPKLKR